MMTKEKKRKKWSQFETQVASLYRQLGYQVTENASVAGQQIDLLAEKIEPGVGKIRLLIECKHRTRQAPVSNQEVYDFISMVKAVAERAQITKGVMITNGSFSDMAFAASEGSGLIELLRSDALDDFFFHLPSVYEVYVREFDANLENNSYIPLAAHYSVSGRRADRKWTNEEKTEDFELLAENWIESGTPFFVSILADYGSGKTTLLNRLKYRYARKYLESESKIKPLYLPLRDFHKFGSLDDFLSASVSKEFSREIPLDIVWRSAASKEILFLIDGFDEMLVRNDQASRLDAFVSISRLLTTAACAFLTCRPSFFVTEEEYEEMVDSVNKIEGAKPAVISITDFSSDRRLQAEQLHSKLLKSLVGYSPLESLTSKISCKVAIESLTHTQIESFLNQFNELYLKTFNRSAQDVRDFLFGIYDLEDLMKRPILLRIIHETVLDGSLSLNSDVESLGPSTLYTIYTNMKLDIDWLKGDARQFLTKEERGYFAETLALLMFDRGQADASIVDILQTVSANPFLEKRLKKKFINVSADRIASDVQVCSFLTRERGNRFRFIHKSFGEFFVARYLKESLDARYMDERFKRTIPANILYFIGGFGFEYPSVQFDLYRKLSMIDVVKESDTARNLIGAILYSSRSHGSGLNLEKVRLFDLNIRGTTFRRSQLMSTCLDNVSWSHCSFYDNDFDEVSFRQSPVKYTKFEDCKLKLAMIDCQWQSLDFLNCSIGISSSDSRIGKSKLSNCKLEVRAASMMEGVSGSSNSGFIFNSTKFDSCTIAVDREVFFSNCTFDQCQFNDVSVTYEGITDSVLRNCSGNMEITFRHEDQAKTVANYLEESNTNLVLKIILPKKRH